MPHLPSAYSAAMLVLSVALPSFAQATIALTAQSNDATTVSYRLTYTGSWTSRQLYLDIDRNALTGYKFNGGAAEFLVADGQLHRYLPPAGELASYQWTWERIGPVSFTDEEPTPGNHVATWVIARSMLGSPAALDISAKIETGSVSERTGRFPHTMSTSTPVLARDPRQQPFSSNSIWNRPIGTGALYVPANLPANPGLDGWTPMPQIDDEYIVLRPAAPLREVRYSSAAWQKNVDRCLADATLPAGVPSSVLANVPMPDDLVVANSGANNSAAFLMQDGRTVTQLQPLARCAAGGYATSVIALAPVDLYGNGIAGTHGGSNLSGLGGSIRVGELILTGTPTQGPPHALKLNLDASQHLHRCGDPTDQRADDVKQKDCYRWPATKADSYALTVYGTKGPAMPATMRMGVLLAIPPSVNIDSLGLGTLGRQIAWSLQNYGAYVVDDTFGPAYALSVEAGPDGSVRTQVYEDSLHQVVLEQRVRDGSKWTQDFQLLITLLQIVDNNGPAPGPAGGGAPLQPMAVELPAL